MNTEAINQTESTGFVSSLLKRLPMTVFWALAAQGIVSVTRILTTITVGGRFAGQESSGVGSLGSAAELSLYSSAFGVLLVLIGLHEGFVTTPLTVFLPKQGKEKEAAFSGNMLLASATFLGIVFSVGVCAFLLLGFLAEETRAVFSVIALVVVLAPLQLLREFSRRWLLANLKVRASALFEILFSVLFLATLVSLFLLSNVSATSAYLAIAAVNVVALAAWWKCFGPAFEFSRVDIRNQLAQNLRYGRWAAAENFLSGITMFFCIWYLTNVLGKVPGGVFAACFNIMLLANPFLLGVCSLLGARAAQEFSNGGWDAMLKTLSQYGAFVFIVLIGFASVLWFFGAELTNLFFKGEYQAWFDANADGVNMVTSTLGLAVPFLGVSFVLSTALLSIGRPNDNCLCAIVGLLVLASINFTFGPDLLVAAMSFVVATIANVLVRIACLFRAWTKRNLETVAT